MLDGRDRIRRSKDLYRNIDGGIHESCIVQINGQLVRRHYVVQLLRRWLLQHRQCATIEPIQIKLEDLRVGNRQHPIQFVMLSEVGYFLSPKKFRGGSYKRAMYHEGFFS